MKNNSNSTSDSILKWIILCGEVVMLNIALGSIYYLYWTSANSIPPHFKRLMLLMTLVYVLCGVQQKHSILSRFARYDELLREYALTLTGFTSLSLLVLWAFRWPLLTWKFMIPFYASIWFFIGLYRWVLRQIIKYYRSKGRNSMRVIFVGNIAIAKSLYDYMKRPYTGYKVLGYYAEKPIKGFPDEEYLGTPTAVPQTIAEGQLNVHAVYCMLTTAENPLINQILNACEHSLIRYNHIPPSFNYQRHAMAFEQQENVPVLHMHNEPLSFLGNRLLKRIFDLVFSTIFLITIFPFVVLIIGTAIKLTSPGPIFFKQKRSGLGGQEFYMYKFRSMRVNKDSDKIQATKNDPRKTKIGEFIRKTSIDELPQFINVWMGDMSIVGPRPHMITHTEQYSELISNYMVRHFAKPGVTGWAQVTGYRGETKELWQMEGRIERDIWYIEHWSFMLDIAIVIRTVTNAIRGEKNAY